MDQIEQWIDNDEELYFDAKYWCRSHKANVKNFIRNNRDEIIQIINRKYNMNYR